MTEHMVGIKVWTHADGRWVWWGSCTCGARQIPAISAEDYGKASAWCDGHKPEDDS